MTNEEIAKLIQEKLQGGKLVAVQSPGGPNPNFVLVFESVDERQGTLTIQSVLAVNSDGATCQTKASINITIGEYRR